MNNVGVAEERESRYVSEQKSLKLREADLIGKLGDAEFKFDEQNSKLVALQLGKHLFHMIDNAFFPPTCINFILSSLLPHSKPMQL